MIQQYFSDEISFRRKPNTRWLLLAEGHAEIGMLEKILDALGADPALATIMCFKGVSRLNVVCRTLAETAGPNGPVTGVGFFIDSDDSPSSRLNSVISACSEMGYNGISTSIKTHGSASVGAKKIIASLSPDNSSLGYIEYLVANEIEIHPDFRAIRRFCKRMNRHLGTKYSLKSEVQAFIMGRNDGGMGSTRVGFEKEIFDIRNAAYSSHFDAVKFLIS